MLYLLAEVTEDKSIRKQMCQWFLKSATDKQFVDWDCAWDFANLAAITASASMEDKIATMTTAMMARVDESDGVVKRF